MNPLDHSLQRLWRAAARVRADEPAAIPVGFETRILAAWRRAGPETVQDWLGLLFRRGLIGATAVVLLSIAWTWLPTSAAATSEQSFVNEVIQEDVVP